MYLLLGFHLIKTVYLFLLLVSQTGADNERNDCLFVSHLTGEDSPYCGSSVTPCQTFPHALRLVRDGGKICLDGRNSALQPYGCLTLDGGPNAVERVIIQKSITIQGQYAEAHISCENPNDLNFATLATAGLLKITLSNLVFNNTGVILRYVCAFNVVITKCRFMNCPYGVGMQQEESFALAYQKSTLAVTDSEFWYNGISILVNLSNEFFNFTIFRCLFQGKKGRSKVTSEDRNTTGAVYIVSRTLRRLPGIRVVGSITDSIFRELGHEDNGFAFSVRIRHDLSDGNLTIFNTSFLNNENSVFVHGGFGLRLTKATINSTYGYAITASGPPKTTSTAQGIKVFLDDCLLADNRIGVRMSTTSCLGHQYLCSTSDQTLVVRNSLFLRGRKTRDSEADAIRFAVLRPTQIKSSEPKPNQKLYLLSDFEAILVLENVTFQELHGCALSVEADKNVHGLISVKNCKFVNNSQFVYRMVERATIRIEIKDEDPPKCRQQKWSNSSEFIWKKKFRLPVKFEDSIFEGNVGVSGALQFMNGNVTIKNCRFKNNEGLTSGGHVLMKTGYGRLNIVNSSFLQTGLKRPSKGKQRVSSYGCFLRSESAGPVTIESSSFTASVDKEFYDPLFVATKCSSMNIDTSSTLLCPSGRRMKREEIVKRAGFEIVKDSDTCWTNVNYVKLFCEKCPDGFYTLQRGSTNGLNINKETDCQKCPYGATCQNGRIVAKENFWGFNVSPKLSRLQFIPCPMEYCKPPTHSDHYIYNGCHGSRSGVLCGQCSNGYSEVLYSTSCRKQDKCNDHWFWMASLIYVMVFALYVVFKPPIFSLLYRQSLWFRKATETGRTQVSPNEDNSDKHDAGYLKIVFYFYQVVELVMVESPEIALHMVPIIPPIIALFNFQVKTMDGSIGCPFPGLTAVTKELFMCLKFLATLFSIGSIYAIHRGISKSFYITPPSLALYLAVALETLLLGYETLADTTLKLMHCVPIGQDWRLFVDGNIQCWQWWQYLFIVFIVVFVIPLVLVLFWGSLMLSNDNMSAKEFLISCAFPLPFLLIWLFRYCKKRRSANQLEPSNSNTNHTEEIKKVLHDSFRPSSDGEHGTLYWESVLTGRRLILLIIHTFVVDPMIRFLCLDCACFIILLHHVSSRPFRNRIANICESISLVSLVVICTFNLAAATYISEGLEPSGPIKNIFQTVQWIEIALLGLLPAAACILVVFAALSQVVRVLYHCIRVLHKCATLALSLGSSSRSQQLLINWDDEELDIVA
ncbi:uncharacterized protein LOC144633132 isoform X1 [Oculina patagonica]